MNAEAFAALGYQDEMKNVSEKIQDAWGQAADGVLTGEQAEAKELSADLAGLRMLIQRLPSGAIDFDPSVEL